jgi:hypothetical protein
MMIDDFGRFWNVYPRRVSVVSTRSAWADAIKVADPEKIIEAATIFANDPNRDPSFTPSSTKWLQEQRWMDSPLPPRKFSPDEARERDLELARERREKEKLEALEATRAEDERRKNAVPIPDHLKRELLEKWGRNVYPKP